MESSKDFDVLTALFLFFFCFLQANELGMMTAFYKYILTTMVRARIMQ